MSQHPSYTNTLDTTWAIVPRVNSFSKVDKVVLLQIEVITPEIPSNILSSLLHFGPSWSVPVLIDFLEICWIQKMQIMPELFNLTIAWEDLQNLLLSKVGLLNTLYDSNYSKECLCSIKERNHHNCMQMVE